MPARIHPLTGAPLEPIHVDRHGRTIWPIMGGSEAAGSGQGGAGQSGGDQGSGTAAAAGQGTGQPAGQGDPGFPANTPVAEMTTEQQVAYWRTQSRKHEGRASERADYEAVKAERDALKAQGMTESEKAIEQARTAALAEGRAAALAETNKGTVTALLDGALRMRGRTDQQVADALRYVNTDAFVTNGAPDTKAILAYAESLAGPATGRQVLDFGAGNRGNPQGLSAREIGLAQAEKRFGKKQQ